MISDFHPPVNFLLGYHCSTCIKKLMTKNACNRSRHFILDLGEDKAVRHLRQNSCPTHPLFLFVRVNKYPAPPLVSFTIQSHRLCFFDLPSKCPVSTPLRSLLYHWKLRRQHPSTEVILGLESTHLEYFASCDIRSRPDIRIYLSLVEF